MNLDPDLINLIAASIISALIIDGAARIPYAPVIRNQLENIDKRFDFIDQRFDEVDKRMDQRFAAVDQRFDAIERRLDGMERRLDVLDTRLWHFVMSGQRNHRPGSEEAES